MELLKISHRYTYGNLPVRLGNLFNISHHTYNTRTRDYLRAPHHTVEKYNNSFLGRSPNLWLHLNEDIKGHKKLKLFSKHYSRITTLSY